MTQDEHAELPVRQPVQPSDEQPEELLADVDRLLAALPELPEGQVQTFEDLYAMLQIQMTDVEDLSGTSEA
jgi:hypothetical protein